MFFRDSYDNYKLTIFSDMNDNGQMSFARLR